MSIMKAPKNISFLAVIAALLMVVITASGLIAQQSGQIYSLPCYYKGKIIPDGILDLSYPNASSVSGDSLRLIASLPAEGGYNRLLMYDCNHNGKLDFIYRGSGSKLYFIENQGSDVFTVVDSISGLFYIPLAVGDFDGDSLTDLAVQEGNYVRILESSSMGTFPKNIVWSFNLDGQYGEGRFEQYAQLTDLDNDGRKEILMTSNTFPLFTGYGYISIFENTSNNNYTRVFYYGLNYQYSIIGYIAVGDYDNNTRTEFACTAGIRDSIYVFEAGANDSFRLEYKTYTGLTNEYPVITGNDLDGDGKKEIFVSGDDTSQPGYRNIKMYEADGGDNFTLNTTIVQYTGLVGFQPVNTGNIFSTARDELVLEGHRIFLYNAPANNTFVVRDSSLFYANATNAFCFDINPGNFAELEIVRYSGNLLIFDNPFITGIQGNNELPSVFSLQQNHPNPFNPSTLIEFDLPSSPLFERGVGGFVSLRIYDPVGREVAILFNQPFSPGSYEVEWDASGYPSGIYFYELRASGFTQAKKMVLMK